MFDEGRTDSWRLDWIIDHYVADFYRLVADLHAQGAAAGMMPGISVVQFYYALVGSAAVFSMAPECRRLTGEEPFSEAFIDAQADAVARLLTGNGASEEQRS